MTRNDIRRPDQGVPQTPRSPEPAHRLHIPLRPGLDTVPAAPLAIHRATVPPEWIDYNGHLNMAYYVLMFDHATDRFFDLIDLGVDYVRRSRHSAFVLETHVTYQREVGLGDAVRFNLQLIGADQKRLHYYFEMYHEEQGFLAATSEQIALHVDLGARRAAPFSAPIERRIGAIPGSHGDLPKPDGVGRSIGIRSGT